MLHSQINFFIISILFCSFFSIFAQPNLSSAAIKLGSIRNLFNEDTASGQFSFYPELQIGGDLTSENLHWALYWGYWNDGFSEASTQNETVNYTQTSHILGGRIYFSTPNVFGSSYPVDIGFMAGYSHHFVQSEIADQDVAITESAEKIKKEFNNVEFGIAVEFLLYGPVNIIGEVQQFIPINADGVNLPANRRAYKTGLTISF